MSVRQLLVVSCLLEYWYLVLIFVNVCISNVLKLLMNYKNLQYFMFFQLLKCHFFSMNFQYFQKRIFSSNFLLLKKFIQSFQSIMINMTSFQTLIRLYIFFLRNVFLIFAAISSVLQLFALSQTFLEQKLCYFKCVKLVYLALLSVIIV